MPSGYEKSPDDGGPKPSRWRFAISIVIFLAAVVGLAMWMSGCTAQADPVRSDQFTVTDGDTIRVEGRKFGTRLVGFNAPEKDRRRAHWEAERRLRVIAKARLKAIVDKGNLDLTFVSCSCLPGTEGMTRSTFSRTCGVLKSNGIDVGDMLIADGMAVPFHCGETSCPPTPRLWCEQGS